MDESILEWLLEPENPGVRYLALRELLDYPPDNEELISAREVAYSQGPIGTILAAMDPQGFWVEPGPGYNPKYRSTVWALILLAQLGASVSVDERIQRACTYLVEHALTVNGQFTMTGTPSGTIDCLQGNLCWALGELGYEDPRLEIAGEWMARSVTGEGIEPVESKSADRRYYGGNCGPLFACGGNNKLSCAWGGAKIIMALSRLPQSQQTPLVQRAIQSGVAFFFSVDPSAANYPSGWASKPSQNWWKFGFPVFYVTDILQIVEALVGLGYGGDPRLANAIAIIQEKQDDQGRWLLEYDYSGKTWGDYGQKKQANKWVSLRALRVLKAINRT